MEYGWVDIWQEICYDEGMGRVWDYFMRRKPLLLAIVAVFMASSILSYQALRGNATDHKIEWISVDNWGGNKVDIPLTGQPDILGVLHPSDVVGLPRVENQDTTSEQTPEYIETIPEIPVEDAPDAVVGDLSNVSDELPPAVSEPENESADMPENDSGDNSEVGSEDSSEDGSEDDSITYIPSVSGENTDFVDGSNSDQDLGVGVEIELRRGWGLIFCVVVVTLAGGYFGYWHFRR